MFCIRRLDIFYFRFFFTEVSASKHLNTTTRNVLFSCFFKETFIYFAGRINVYGGSVVARGP
jgi:hypothetical protein